MSKEHAASKKRKDNAISSIPMQLKLHRDDQRKRIKKRSRVSFPITQNSFPNAAGNEEEDTNQITNMILDDRQRSLQFLREAVVHDDSTMSIPSYMKQFLPYSLLPTGSTKYEGDLEERMARYKQQVLSLRTRDRAHRKAHVRKEYKMSKQRKVHYMLCKFLWICKFFVGEEAWNDVMGPVVNEMSSSFPFMDAGRKGHIDSSNMQTLLFGFDLTKFEDAEELNGGNKVEGWKQGMLAARKLYERMKAKI